MNGGGRALSRTSHLIDGSLRAMASSPMYYSEYLGLPRLLSAQHLESERQGEPAHDEMLFIIVHQAYELWFKQILWELDAVRDVFSQPEIPERRLGAATLHLERIASIQRLLIDQIGIVETMTPLDFLDFRDFLIPASGFQSVQFRLIENRLGMKREARLRYENDPYVARFRPEDREKVIASENEDSLFDLVERWLDRTPFLHVDDFDFWREYRAAVNTMLGQEKRLIEANEVLTDGEIQSQIDRLDQTRDHFEALFDEDKHRELVDAGQRRMSLRALQAALLIQVYRDEPILHQPFRLLQTLVDIDENLTTWRQRHALMVLRMIGSKVGTGGSSGHEYLRMTATEHRIFGDLFNLATFFIRRSHLPELPARVRRSMDFRFSSDQ